MEHIVQFGICIDDEAIRKNVTNRAEKEIIAKITESVESELFGRDYYGRVDKSNVARWVQDKVGDFISRHKDEIIADTVERLVDRLMKTKAVKEAAAKAVDAASENSAE